MFLRISVTYVTFYSKLQIMTLEIAYKNESCSPTLRRKAWLLFSVRNMSWGLRNPSFFSFLWSVVCKRPVINVTLITLKIPTKKTRPIGYFPIVLMKLFVLYTLQLDININCNICDMYFCSPELLMSLFYEIADNNLKYCISE